MRVLWVDAPCSVLPLRLLREPPRWTQAPHACACAQANDGEPQHSPRCGAQRALPPTAARRAPQRGTAPLRVQMVGQLLRYASNKSYAKFADQQIKLLVHGRAKSSVWLLSQVLACSGVVRCSLFSTPHRRCPVGRQMLSRYRQQHLYAVFSAWRAVGRQRRARTSHNAALAHAMLRQHQRAVLHRVFASWRGVARQATATKRKLTEVMALVTGAVAAFETGCMPLAPPDVAARGAPDASGWETVPLELALELLEEHAEALRTAMRAAAAMREEEAGGAGPARPNVQ